MHEADIEKEHTRVPNTEEEENLYKVFYLSFRYSQGDGYLQSRIFAWLFVSGYLESNLQEVVPSYLLRIVPPVNHIALSDSISGGAYDQTIKNNWKELHQVIQGGYNSTHLPDILKSTLRWMLSQDLDYQEHNREGRLNLNTFSPDSREDPHASFIRKYAVLKTEAGHPAFNCLFNQLSQLIVQFRTHPVLSDIDVVAREITMGLQGLENRWSKNHPGYTFYPKNF